MGLPPAGGERWSEGPSNFSPKKEYPSPSSAGVSRACAEHRYPVERTWSRSLGRYRAACKPASWRTAELTVGEGFLLIDGFDPRGNFSITGAWDTSAVRRGGKSDGGYADRHSRFGAHRHRSTSLSPSQHQPFAMAAGGHGRGTWRSGSRSPRATIRAGARE